MSDIRKLIDTINEMATTSGSVASVAQPMGGVKSRKKDSIFYEGEKCTSCGCEPCKCDSSEGNAVDGTKTPQSPNVSEFGLWKNSALIGQEQREKKKKKSVKESEDLAWDDPDLEKARKLITSKKKDGYTEFKGIDKAILKLKSKNKNTRKHPVNEPKKVKENKAVPYEGDREYNALDDVQDQIAKMAHRHKDEKWTMDDYRRLGKKLAQQSSKTKLDELGNSLMPGGQRSLHLAQETFVDPRNSRRHPGAVDENEQSLSPNKDNEWKQTWLQKTIDFANKTGFQIKTNPSRTKAIFINKQLGFGLQAMVKNNRDDGLTIRYGDLDGKDNFNTDLAPDEFHDEFVRLYKDAKAGRVDQGHKFPTQNQFDPAEPEQKYLRSFLEQDDVKEGWKKK